LTLSGTEHTCRCTQYATPVARVGETHSRHTSRSQTHNTAHRLQHAHDLPHARAPPCTDNEMLPLLHHTLT